MTDLSMFSGLFCSAVVALLAQLLPSLTTLIQL